MHNIQYAMVHSILFFSSIYKDILNLQFHVQYVQVKRKASTNWAIYASVTFTLRRPYGVRKNRVIPAVAAGPPYGEFLCFTGRSGGRRIIARSFIFFFISTFAVEICHTVAVP